MNENQEDFKALCARCNIIERRLRWLDAETVSFYYELESADTKLTDIRYAFKEYLGKIGTCINDSLGTLEAFKVESATLMNKLDLPEVES